MVGSYRRVVTLLLDELLEERERRREQLMAQVREVRTVVQDSIIGDFLQVGIDSGAGLLEVVVGLRPRRLGPVALRLGLTGFVFGQLLGLLGPVALLSRRQALVYRR